MACKYPALLSLIFVAAAAGQTTPIAFSNLTIAIIGANNTYTTSLTGSGTATFAGGSAQVKMTGSATRKRGLNCGDDVLLSITFTSNVNDSLTISAHEPSGTGSAPQPFNVTSGTGIYQGKGGSGTIVASLTGSTISGSGSGTLTSQLSPVASIFPSGIVPLFSTVPIVQPASWISIYGANLANTTTVWNGDFPVSLGNVSVSIDNKPGYLWLVSPGQINVQVPDDTTQGCVTVTVTTPNGVANSNITLQPQQPSFSLLSARYVVGEIPTPNGSGAYGSGTGSYDLMGPAGAFSFNTRPVKTGETIVLFGVGFGPTMTPTPAGKFPADPSPTVLTPDVTIGGVHAQVAFAGLIGAGLYQLNVVVPQVSSGDQIIQATIPAHPILFSSNATQNCLDDDPQGAMPTSCAVYVSVK